MKDELLQFRAQGAGKEKQGHRLPTEDGQRHLQEHSQAASPWSVRVVSGGAGWQDCRWQSGKKILGANKDKSMCP